MSTRASAAPQKLFVEPAILYFPPPLTRGISNVVTVYNSTNEPCVFKVHSFEPELYTVRPSSAVLAANAACRVHITLRKMSSEPTDYTDLTRKQRFKVRAKAVPADVYAKVSAAANAKDSQLSSSDVWKLCDAVPLALDQTLSCNFSGELPAGAAVTFEDGSSPSASADPRRSVPPAGVAPINTAAAAAAAATATAAANNRNVTFGANGSNPTANPPATAVAPLKSSLKADGSAVTPRNAGDIVASESAQLTKNTAAKAQLSAAVGDKNAQLAQLEREIRERQQLLDNLKLREAAAAASTNKGGSDSSKKKKGGPKLPLAIVLILLILFYIGGAVARLKVGPAVVDGYVENVVPTEVRSVAKASKTALDELVSEALMGDAITAMVASVTSASLSSASAAAPAATPEGEAAAAVKVVEAATKPAVVVVTTDTETAAAIVDKVVAEAVEKDKTIVVDEVVVGKQEEPPAAVPTPASVPPAGDAAAPEKKKRRRRKVKKADE